MFFVWDVNGIQRPHVSGQPRKIERAIEQISAARPNEKVQRQKKDNEPELSGGKTQNAIAEYRKAQKENKERQPAILAQSILSSPVFTLSPDSNLEEASEAFRTHRFRHIPILSDEKKLVGILSDRDALKHALSSENLAAVLIRDVMATEVLSARPETSIREIARIMFDERIGSVPIVDEDEHLKGMITRADVLRAVVNEAPLELWI